MDPVAEPAPLTGISSPLEAFAPLIARIDVTSVVSVTFALLFLVWVIYTVIASYHLLRYGHSSAVAIPAILTHVLVSFLLSLFAISGLTPN